MAEIAVNGLSKKSQIRYIMIIRENFNKKPYYESQSLHDNDCAQQIINSAQNVHDKRLIANHIAGSNTTHPIQCRIIAGSPYPNAVGAMAEVCFTVGDSIRIGDDNCNVTKELFAQTVKETSQLERIEEVIYIVPKSICESNPTYPRTIITELFGELPKGMAIPFIENKGQALVFTCTRTKVKKVELI